MRKKILPLFIFCGLYLTAQEHQEAFKNLDQFKSQAGNWQIVGEVAVDPHVDVHKWEERQAAKAAENAKKKRRKRKQKNEAVEAHPVSFVEGTGILLNFPDPSKKSNLISQWEHGDIILELEVLVPKGSNSGIYLQGRYEVQVKDSWGVLQPKYSDIGGIYRNWEEAPGKRLIGVAPLDNAAKAPGLWQKFRIHFQAPKFDADGNKIANAKFLSVDLNGVRIHTNVDVPLPTGGPISKEEVAKGPLMIQGDHGPIAYRNMSYTLLKESQVTISKLEYKTFSGEFKGLGDLEGKSTQSEGTAKAIDISVTESEDNYGIVYSGALEIPETGDYTFSIDFTGGVDFQLNGKSLLSNNSATNERKMGLTTNLTEGSHSFVLTNIKSASWRAPKLGLTIQSPSSNPKIFNVFDSNPPQVSRTAPKFVDVGAEPQLLRGFVYFNGNGKGLSHTIGVGAPKGPHFVYDLGSANVIGAWRGDFVDATPMWHNRGNGSFRPRGATLWTFLNQSIAQLDDSGDAFPETGERPNFITKGYVIDRKSKLPVFKHVYKGVEIENRIVPNASQTHIVREISFSETGLTNWYCKLAEGAVKNMADGSFLIEDNQYYIKVLSGQSPTVRENDGKTELIIPVDGSNIKYEIIW